MDSPAWWSPDASIGALGHRIYPNKLGAKITASPEMIKPILKRGVVQKPTVYKL